MRSRIDPRVLLVGALLLVTLAVVAVVLERANGTAAGGTERPNILVIVVDDTRPEALNVMPQTQRAFGQDGVSFSNAFTVNPLCCPARASIMTGRYAHNHGIRSNQDTEIDESKTLQGYLQRNGYTTVMAGKYLNGWDETAAAPPFFDRWAAIDDSRYGRVYRGYQANVDGEVVAPDVYSTHFVTDHGVGLLHDLEANDERPWFMYLAPFSAHATWEAEERYADAAVPRWEGNPAVFEKDRSDKPPWVQERDKALRAGRWLAVRQSRTLMSADDMVAKIFSTLAELDEERDTLAVFVSDSGYLWAEHRTNAKRLPYTPAVRVPLMLRWPGRLGTAIHPDRIVGIVDLAPTLLEAAGITPEEPMDGRSLLSGGPRESVLVEFFGSRLGADVPEWAALRGTDHHYVEYYDASGETIFREFYDLIDDPFELENLYGDDDLTNDPPGRWSERLREARACSGAGCP